MESSFAFPSPASESPMLRASTSDFCPPASFTASNEVDTLTCPNWRSKMSILAFIAEPAVIARILDPLDKGSR